jgi:hypothetical protein
MTNDERHAEMAKALARKERELVSLRYDQTQRALVYLEDGMPIADLLAALGISQSTWYRRVKDLRERYDRRPVTGPGKRFRHERPLSGGGWTGDGDGVLASDPE